jgi:fumarate hydratase subunit beta
MERRVVQVPFDDEAVSSLLAGEMIALPGLMYGARDAAHKRMVEAAAAGRRASLCRFRAGDLLCGPVPAKPGHVIGPAGPTTSGRMDPYTIPLLERGVKGLIGKGYRSAECEA